MLQEKNQNFWQLASIQNAAFGLTYFLSFGESFSRNYDLGSIIVSIILGNLILWAIGLSIVAISFSERMNAIETFMRSIGKFGGIFSGLVIIFTVILWFPIQIKSAADAQLKTVELMTGFDLPLSFSIRVGAGFGLIVSLISTGGIRLTKWIATICFPILFLFVAYLIIFSLQTTKLSFSGSWNISSQIVAASILLTLPGTVNLPTFFRHARSKTDAFFAISLVAIFTSFFEMAGAFVKDSNMLYNAKLFGNQYLSYSMVFLAISISLACINLVNIYYAASAWEIIFPQVTSAKKYAITGMVGTAIFALLQINNLMLAIENSLSGFVCNLGVIALCGYLVEKIVNHRQRSFEQIINLICWLTGCLAVVLIQIRASIGSPEVIFSGVGVTALSFVIVVFVEESIWSLKRCIVKKSNFVAK